MTAAVLLQACESGACSDRRESMNRREGDLTAVFSLRPESGRAIERVARAVVDPFADARMP